MKLIWSCIEDCTLARIMCIWFSIRVICPYAVVMHVWSWL